MAPGPLYIRPLQSSTSSIVLCVPIYTSSIVFYVLFSPQRPLHMYVLYSPLRPLQSSTSPTYIRPLQSSMQGTFEKWCLGHQAEKKKVKKEMVPTKKEMVPGHQADEQRVNALGRYHKPQHRKRIRVFSWHLDHRPCMCVCLLMQDLSQSCSCGGRGVVEDMCCER